MNLISLLKAPLNNIKPTGMVIIYDNHKYFIQKVICNTAPLNLGVILLAFYCNDKDVQRLKALKDCLSIGHYYERPQALQYGRNFTNNPDFKHLTAKTKKHLTDGLVDGTISYSRDLGAHQNYSVITNLNLFLHKSLISNVYLFKHDTWFIQNHHQLVDLNHFIEQQLVKKASK